MQLINLLSCFALCAARVVIVIDDASDAAAVSKYNVGVDGHESILGPDTPWFKCDVQNRWDGGDTNPICCAKGWKDGQEIASNCRHTCYTR